MINPDPKTEIILELFAHVDIESVFIVQAIVAVIRAGLNLLVPDRHTDWLAPFVALAVGLTKAYLLIGTGLPAVMYGLYLAGGAIMFATFWSKAQTGMKMFSKEDVDDPVIKAKIEKSKTKAHRQIEAVKKLLKRSK